MKIWLELPDAAVKQLADEGQDLSRAALEPLAIDAYRMNRITGHQPGGPKDADPSVRTSWQLSGPSRRDLSVGRLLGSPARAAEIPVHQIPAVVAELTSEQATRLAILGMLTPVCSCPSPLRLMSPATGS